MTSETFVDLFDELGIYDHQRAPNLGRTLKYGGADLPSLYFNRNREGVVYFTGYMEDKGYFRESLWEEIPDHRLKLSDGGRLNIIPMAGRREACLSVFIRFPSTNLRQDNIIVLLRVNLHEYGPSVK